MLVFSHWTCPSYLSIWLCVMRPPLSVYFASSGPCFFFFPPTAKRIRTATWCGMHAGITSQKCVSMANKSLFVFDLVLFLTIILQVQLCRPLSVLYIYTYIVCCSQCVVWVFVFACCMCSYLTVSVCVRGWVVCVKPSVLCRVWSCLLEICLPFSVFWEEDLSLHCLMYYAYTLR